MKQPSKLGKHWRWLGESGVERTPKRDEAKRKLTEREMNTSAISKRITNAQYESAVKWGRGEITQ